MALKILVSGTGKDGTFSICELIRNAFELNGESCKIAHEPNIVEITSAHTRYLETGDSKWREKIAAILRSWDLDVAVSGGIDFCLNVFLQEFGKGLRLIHMKRNKEAFLKSVMNIAQVHPHGFGNYMNSDVGFTLHRQAAFHYAEMTREEWNAISSEARFGW